MQDILSLSTEILATLFESFVYNVPHKPDKNLKNFRECDIIVKSKKNSKKPEVTPYAFIPRSVDNEPRAYGSPAARASAVGRCPATSLPYA